MQSRITRTYLAVPVHLTKLVESAARSQADAVFLDLEDAVPEAQKSNALDSAIRALMTYMRSIDEEPCPRTVSTMPAHRQNKRKTKSTDDSL
jgi:citrate lyase beta subunit